VTEQEKEPVAEVLGRAKRGPYRSTYTVILNEPDFVDGLNTDEKVVWWTLKHWPEGNLAHLFVFYMEPLTKRTSLPEKRAKAALTGLEQKGWIKLDWKVQLVWIVNGLKWSPEVSLKNENHRIGTLKCLNSLPRSPLILQFCEYYSLPVPIGYPCQGVLDTHADGGGIPIEITDPDRQILNTDPEENILSPEGDDTDGPYSKQFKEFWEAYPVRPTHSKKKAWRKWQTRLRQAVKSEDMIAAARHYAQAREGQDAQFTLHAGTFLGPDEHWKAYVTGVPEEDDTTAAINRWKAGR